MEKNSVNEKERGGTMERIMAELDGAGEITPELQLLIHVTHLALGKFRKVIRELLPRSINH